MCSYNGGSDDYLSLSIIGLSSSKAAAAALQRFDLLTFQSLDHHCNGLADSTWTSWPRGATEREATERVCWRLSQSVEAIRSHARSDLFHPSAASTAQQWLLINWQTKKNPPESLQMPNIVLTPIIFNIMESWCCTYGFSLMFKSTIEQLAVGSLPPTFFCTTPCGTQAQPWTGLAVFHLSQNTVKCVFVHKHPSRKVSLLKV